MVTIRDIAGIAGVSYSTVSKALNDSPLVKPETKQRIIQIARDQGYQKNLVATHLASGRTRLIGLVLDNVSNPVFATMANHLHWALRARGYHMMLTISPEDVELLSQLQVDGLILWGDVLRTHPQSLEYLQMHQRATIVLGADEDPGAPSIQFDRRAGLLEAVKYLQEFGHRHIGIIGSTQEIKIRAFMEALKALGLEAQSDYLFPGELTWEGGYRALKSASRNRPFPTAFIGLNNLVTKGALRALLELGYTVPTDVSLVGYDNLPEMQFAEVPVTTVGPLLEEAANRASALIVSLIEGTSSRPPIVIRPVLTPRASLSECPIPTLAP